MEYVQMTLDDWMSVKDRLRKELQSIKQGFVRVGYVLRQIDDQKLYERDGYKSIADFAKAEYGLEPSTTSRFMAINREYSIDGYSERIRPEYLDMGRSQLEEMLRLPEEDRSMIQPQTAREDIRELKRFNRDHEKEEETKDYAGDSAGETSGTDDQKQCVAEEMNKLIEGFFHESPDVLNEVYEKDYTEEQISRFADLCNPSGSRSFRMGMYFMMMYENRICIKKFGSEPKDITWTDFYRMMRFVFDKAAAGGRTWQTYFKEELPDTQEKKSGKPEKVKVKGIAPAQKKKEKQEKKENKETPHVQADKERAEEAEEVSKAMAEKTSCQGADEEPERAAVSAQIEEAEEPEAVASEVVTERYMTRRAWLEGQSTYRMALELAAFGEKVKGQIEWQLWLEEAVDEQGDEKSDQCRRKEGAE